MDAIKMFAGSEPVSYPCVRTGAAQVCRQVLTFLLPGRFQHSWPAAARLSVAITTP